TLFLAAVQGAEHAPLRATDPEPCDVRLHDPLQQSEGADQRAERVVGLREPCLSLRARPDDARLHGLPIIHLVNTLSMSTTPSTEPLPKARQRRASVQGRVAAGRMRPMGAAQAGIGIGLGCQSYDVVFLFQ